MRLSIILPVKNEPYLPALLNNIHIIMKEFELKYPEEYEVIIIDASDDYFTTPSVTGAQVYHQYSKGLGKAILQGMGWAEGDVIVTMDADGSHNPYDIPFFLKEMEQNNYDIVVGSKYAKGGFSNDTFWRRKMSRMASKATKIILRLPVEDTMSGFVAVKKSIVRNTELNPLGFKIFTELMFKNRHAKILEYNIWFSKRKSGKSKFGAVEFLRTGLFVLKLRFEFLRSWRQGAPSGAKE